MSKQEKKDKKPKKTVEAAPDAGKAKAAKPKGPQVPSRLHVRYGKEVIPTLLKHFKYTNVMAVPKLEKIVINMGLGEAVANAKIMDVAVAELGQIAGQRPSSPRRRNPSRISSCGRTCRSARRSLCVESGCTNSSTV